MEGIKTNKNFCISQQENGNLLSTKIAELRQLKLKDESKQSFFDNFLNN